MARSNTWLVALVALCACTSESAGTAVGKDDGAVPAAALDASREPVADAGRAPAALDAGRPAALIDAGQAQAAHDADVTLPMIDAGGMTSACGICDAYGTSQQTGTIDEAGPSSLSGLALSRAQPGIAFVHDDHERAVVYAIDLQGRVHARFTLENAGASDLEDIAVGPCGKGSCVYLGDIGDNAAVRGEYAVLRFAEPTVPSEPGTTSTTVDYERFAFHYEDGSHNAESLMVAPDGTVYVITKLAPGTGGNVRADGPSSVYRLPVPLSSGAVATAREVATLPVPAAGDQAASAAAAHPCGLGFLLRTYDRVYEFRVPAGASFEDAFAATPRVVAMPSEPQSEGIDYRSDGRGFVSSGEGASAPIMATDCR